MKGYTITDRMVFAAYCRVSTDSDMQLESLENQKLFFADYARKNDCQLYKLYADEGLSGKQAKNREQFLQMLKDAERHLFNVVVVKDISRFARNTVDFLVAIRKLKALGIETIFLSNNQTVLESSEFVLTVFSALAQEESASLSKRVKFGKKVNAKKGRVPTRIFGYDRLDNFTLEINPEEAAVVRRIFDMYVAEGLGCRRIAANLIRDGVKTKYGHDWTGQYVRRILKNPVYCGIFVNNKYEILDYLEGTRGKIKPEEHYYHDRPGWAVVSRETFDAAQKLLTERQAVFQNEYIHMTGRNSTRHIFSTLIKCAHCGRSFSRKSYTYVNTRIYWKCSTNDRVNSSACDNAVTIDEDILLGKIAAYLSEIIKDRDVFIADILNELQKTPDNKDIEIVSMEKRKKKLLNLIEKYKEMYVCEIITITELKEKNIAAQKELSDIEAAIEKAHGLPGDDPSEKTDVLTKEIKRFLCLETVTNVDLKAIISKIVVDREGNVQIIMIESG